MILKKMPIVILVMMSIVDSDFDDDNYVWVGRCPCQFAFRLLKPHDGGGVDRVSIRKASFQALLSGRINLYQFVFYALTIFLMLTIFYSPEFFPLLQEFGQKLPFPTSLQQSLSDNPTCFSSVYSKYRIYSKDDDGFEKTVICPN